MNIRKEVIEAEKRIKTYIRETPLDFSSYLSQKCGANVYLKLENFQITGSFKIRGALNKILSLNSQEKKKIITASSGNHGIAVAYVLDKFDYKGIVYLPKNTSSAKVEILRSYTINIKFYGDDCIETEKFAKKIAEDKDYIYISPYNDYKIIGGQGTIAIELERQLKEIDAIFIPVGGGGLISGISGYLKPERPDIKIIGCQPRNSPIMYESIKAGRIVELKSEPTISDATAGGIEVGSITFDICKKYVDEFIIVEENEIKNAIKLMLDKNSMIIEGAGALSIASFLKVNRKFRNKNVVLIISGARI
ncbi:threonine/serine dehydratase, partial [Candidatus Aminicenantes bacterium AC-708-M15]|nr:threonine/serine dehydratase [Candidatus Aminicenantes bacterium AC-708-M15]MCP2606547.1 threonine/serine dehydratase [Candidatus Aminicenantes bacterium AC-708-I09]MCP2618903.1 threonine/serine dehydratase [Candidatus Aminicenantes bacterium AC-335-A11]